MRAPRNDIRPILLTEAMRAICNRVLNPLSLSPTFHIINIKQNVHHQRNKQYTFLLTQCVKLRFFEFGNL